MLVPESMKWEVRAGDFKDVTKQVTAVLAQKTGVSSAVRSEMGERRGTLGCSSLYSI